MKHGITIAAFILKQRSAITEILVDPDINHGYVQFKLVDGTIETFLDWDEEDQGYFSCLITNQKWDSTKIGLSAELNISAPGSTKLSLDNITEVNYTLKSHKGDEAFECLTLKENYAKGVAYYQKKKYLEAADHLRAACKQSPADSEQQATCYYSLALIYVKLENYTRADVYIQTCTKIRLMLSSKDKNSETKYNDAVKKLMEISKLREADGLNDLAMEAYRNKKYIDSVDNLLKAIKTTSVIVPLSNKLAYLHLEAAVSYRAINQLDEAEKHMKQSLEMRIALLGENHLLTKVTRAYLQNISSQINTKNNAQDLLIKGVHANNVTEIEEAIRLGANVNMKKAHPVNLAQVVSVEEAPIHIAATDNPTPLHLAIFCGHENIAMLLLQRGADPTQVDCEMNTALHFAASKGMKRVAAYIIANNKEIINAQTRGGQTALHNAAKYGRNSIIISLLNAGANYQIRDRENSLPIHMAAYFSTGLVNFPAIQVLVKAGCSLTVKGPLEMTPYDCAKQNGNMEMAKQIQDLVSMLAMLTRMINGMPVIIEPNLSSQSERRPAP